MVSRSGATQGHGCKWRLSSAGFILAAEKAIASPKSMLVVLHEWSNHRRAKNIRGSFKVITVTEENRDALIEEIAKEIKGRIQGLGEGSWR